MGHSRLWGRGYSLVRPGNARLLRAGRPLGRRAASGFLEANSKNQIPRTKSQELRLGRLVLEFGSWFFGSFYHILMNLLRFLQQQFHQALKDLVADPAPYVAMVK